MFIIFVVKHFKYHILIFVSNQLVAQQSPLGVHERFVDMVKNLNQKLLLFEIVTISFKLVISSL